MPLEVHMSRKRKRRSFSAEYKAEVVKLVLQGKSIGKVSRDLDLTESAVRKWVKQAEVDSGNGPPGELTTDEREELHRLRKENMQLRMEREILKKATAFFAKENS
jgi:transposase